MNRSIALAVVAILALDACQKKAPPPPYALEPVVSRDVVVTVNANGSIQPKDSVEIKSKASGEIMKVNVQTGDEVKKGEQLVQVDPRNPSNTLAQAQADLDVAKAQLANAESQYRRADELWKTKSISEVEHETAVLSQASAKAQLVRAQTNLENAKIAFQDTDVRAPKDGVVLSKNVDVGTVIQSATGTVGGGTVLLKMANLDTVQVRAMVDETDIGKLQAGLPVSIKVDAYPNRTFNGVVLKIEPQSIVQQNVTLFPVTMVLPNPDHVLRPGMNTEIAITVGERHGVMTIPNAALRTQRDVASAAGVIGISMDVVNQQLAASRGGDSANHASLGGSTRMGDSGKSQAMAGGETYTTQDGRQVTLPAGVTSAQVEALVAKMRASRGGGAALTDDERALSQQLRTAGVFGRGGRGGRGGNRAGGDQAGGDQSGGDQGGSQPQFRRRNTSYQFGGNYIVFVMRNGKPTAVEIKTGLTNLDYSEVVNGLTTKDTVLLLPSASLVASQEQFRQRTQQRSGLPGMTSTSGGGGGGRGPGR